MTFETISLIIILCVEILLILTILVSNCLQTRLYALFLSARYKRRQLHRVNTSVCVDVKKHGPPIDSWLHESLEIVQPRFQKFNSKYIESIKIVRAISWVRGTFQPVGWSSQPLRGGDFIWHFECKRERHEESIGVWWHIPPGKFWISTFVRTLFLVF
jgi:hypothetical protein